MKDSNHLLILRTGDAPESVRREYGNFDRMFIEAGEIHDARVEVVYLPDGARPEAPENYAGVMITGSAAMVTDKLALERVRRRLAASGGRGSPPVFGAVTVTSCWRMRWAAKWVITPTAWNWAPTLSNRCRRRMMRC